MSDAASLQAKQSWLAYFPSLSFGTVMGVTGLGLAWRRAEEMMDWSTLPGDIILLIGALILVLSIPLYGLKMARYPEIFAADIDHPIKSAFIAGLPMAMVLQVSALAPINAQAAEILWLIAAPLSLLINFYIFSRWYLIGQGTSRMNALWLIPAAGSFLIAMAGVQIGYYEAAWFFFSIGVVFGGGLLLLMINRYIIEPRLPDPLVPSYFVLLVPPGLISIIYPELTDWQMGDEISGFTRIAFYFCVFLLLFHLAMFKIFWRLKFSLSWWAYTFPLDTISAAAIVYAHSTGNIYLEKFAMVLLVVSTVFILYILARTLIEVARGNVFKPE